MKTVAIVLATLIGLWVIKQIMIALANMFRRRIQSDTRNCAYCCSMGAAHWVYDGKKGGPASGVCAACLPNCLGPVPLDWALSKGYLTPLPPRDVAT